MKLFISFSCPMKGTSDCYRLHLDIYIYGYVYILYIYLANLRINHFFCCTQLRPILFHSILYSLKESIQDMAEKSISNTLADWESWVRTLSVCSSNIIYRILCNLSAFGSPSSPSSGDVLIHSFIHSFVHSFIFISSRFLLNGKMKYCVLA